MTTIENADPNYIAFLKELLENATAADLLKEDYSDRVGYRSSSLQVGRRDLSTTMTVVGQFFCLGASLDIRTFLLRNMAIISGSIALSAFHPQIYEPNNLDIYAPISAASSVQQYIEGHGYVLALGPPPPQSNTPSVHSAQKFLLGTKIVNVVYSRTECAAQLVPESHSTVTMNYIGYFGAVCLYPGITLYKRSLQNSTGASADTCFNKYQTRGIEYMDAVDKETHFCRVDDRCASTVRSLHDAGVLYIPFVGMSDHLWKYEKNLSWKLNNKACGENSPGYTVGYAGTFVQATALPAE